MPSADYQLATLTSESKEHGRQISDLKETAKERDDELKEALANISKRLGSLESIANRGLGMFFGLSLLAAGVGSFWTKITEVFKAVGGSPQ